MVGSLVGALEGFPLGTNDRLGKCVCTLDGEVDESFVGIVLGERLGKFVGVTDGEVEEYVVGIELGPLLRIVEGVDEALNVFFSLG